jgi:thiol-disulfide isomerase/thioredoxin
MNWSEYLKKHKSNIFFILFLALLFFPPTGRPIKIWVNRLLMTSPKEISEEKVQKLTDYNFIITDLEGNKKNFSELQSNKILINYWATWCPPCIAEMPSLINLYEQTKEDVAFLFIVNEDPEIIKEFITKRGWDIPIYYTIGAIPEILYHKSLPTTLFIDSNGNILIRKVGAAKWDSSQMLELLKK